MAKPVPAAPGLSGLADTTAPSLPTDIMQDIGRRVHVAALVFAVVWIIVGVAAHLTASEVHDPRIHYFWDRHGPQLVGVVVALSIAVAWAARRFAGKPDLVLHLGLLYQVICAIAVAFVSQWNPPWPGRGISWNVIEVLLFAAIVPAKPRAVLLTGLLVATAEPVVYAFAVRAGVAVPPLPAYQVVWAFFPTYLAAFLSVIPAKIVRNLGQAVREARELGAYRLEERLGAGGMGEVYRASHRLLARPAAIKLISPAQLGGHHESGRQLLAERFRREASAAASLRSPHTIELYDFGVAPDGTLYFAMELLDGIDLQTLVERHGPQPPERVAHFLKQACLSLGEAHRRGLVHRDIKPSNLMTCRMGTEVDFLKVLDFGLVKSVGLPGDAQLTAPDVTAGTPAYLPPEALDGVATLDHRADLYALGCVAYWLLAGRPVFQGPSPLAILLKHGREIPARLDSPLGPVPPGLEELVMRCLEKDRDRRPEDAIELRAALERVPIGEWTSDRAAEWWSRNLPEAPR